MWSERVILFGSSNHAGIADEAVGLLVVDGFDKPSRAIEYLETVCVVIEFAIALVTADWAA